MTQIQETLPMAWFGAKDQGFRRTTIVVPAKAEVAKALATVVSSALVIWAVPSATLSVAGTAVAVTVGLLAARLVRTFFPENTFSEFQPIDAAVIIGIGVGAARFAGLATGIVPYAAAYLIGDILTKTILGG